MLDTKPVYGDKSQLGCSKVFIRFKEPKMKDTFHHLGDIIGSQLILFNYNPMDSSYTITYINGHGMVLARVSYSREAVVEVSLTESVCRVQEIPSKPPLKVV